jgi:cytochrome P450
MTPSPSAVDDSREIFDPMSAPSHEELVAILQQMQDETPVYYWSRHNMWVVTRYDTVLDILRDPSIFSVEGKMTAKDEWYSPKVWSMLESTSHRRGSGTKVMGTADGSEHTRLREPFKQAFQPRSINRYEVMVREVCEELLAELRPRGRANWLKDFAKPLPMRVILDVLGLPRGDAATLGRWSDSLMDLIAATLSPQAQEERATDVVAFEQYMRDAMATRRAEPGRYPGLMDQVLTSMAAGELDSMTDDELVASWTMEMLIGGHETTASALTSSLSHLLEDRSRWEALCADPEQIPKAVEEFLRYEPPVVGFFRHTTRETEIAGVSVPAGAQVFWVNYAANHDRRRFENPDTLDVARPNVGSHLAFGKGVHNCLGAPLARLELRVAYQVLTEQMKDLRLAPDQGPLEYVPSIRMRVPRGLEVEWYQ